MEIEILDFIQSHMRTAFGDILMPFISLLGNKGMIWLLMAAVLAVIPKYREYGAAMFFSLVIGFIICNITLKPIAARMRPFEIADNIKLLIAAPADYSFPSGHTVAAFSATFALLFSKTKLWIPTLAAAVLMAFSRMYLYVHFPTDILGGIAVGFLSGYIGKKVLDIIITRFKEANS